MMKPAILAPVVVGQPGGTPSRPKAKLAAPACLVVIANYGTTNDRYMQRLLMELRSIRLPLELHVLTNVEKDWGANVAVHVGLPTRNPRSLPFAHRRLFAERLAKADYFVYCEDDTLVTERNLRAFIEVNGALGPDEIPGFLRVEQTPDGACYVESAHGHFRWNTNSLVWRGASLFATFTNHHSAFTMASRAQVQRAIESGGFLVDPHVGRFAMLECGASDLYTQCGLTRLISVSRIEDFLVRHLSNSNSLRWGLRYDEFLAQARALQRIELEDGWRGSLLDVETRMPRGWWSKRLYEQPDGDLMALVPKVTKTVLSVGAGWGATEASLAEQGKKVTGLPVDAVFGDCLRRRQIETVEGSFATVVSKLKPRQFDVVLMENILQLLPNPVEWLSMLRPLLSAGGVLLASVPKTFDPLRLIWCLRGERAAAFPGPFEVSHVQKVSRSRLRRWFATAGMEADIRPFCSTPARVRLREWIKGMGEGFLMDRFVIRARGQMAR